MFLKSIVTEKQGSNNTHIGQTAVLTGLAGKSGTGKSDFYH